MYAIPPVYGDSLLDNLPPLNWKRAKAVEATAAKLKPEALEILPLLCQSGQQGQ